MKTPSDLATLFMDVVPHAMREYRKEMRKSRSATLSVPQFRILALLWRRGPANNRTLAEEQGVSVAAMSRMIDWLSRHGLVERLENTADRRQVQVQLTSKGRSRFERFRKAAHSRLRSRLGSLNVQERRSLDDGLQALAVAVEHLGESAAASASQG